MKANCVICQTLTLSQCEHCQRPYCSVECQLIDHNQQSFVDNIDTLTLQNTEYGPRVIFNDPGGRIQLTVMSVPSGDNVPMEVHEKLSQFIRIEAGTGELEVDGVIYPFGEGSAAVVPAGSKHEIRNTGKGDLKLYSIYAKNEWDEWEH